MTRLLDARRTLAEWQWDFALTEPELILNYDRDRFQLSPAELLEVRRTQREYVEIWVQVIGAAAPAGDVRVDRTRAHAVIGLINAAPRIPRSTGMRQSRAALAEMAWGHSGFARSRPFPVVRWLGRFSSATCPAGRRRSRPRPAHPPRPGEWAAGRR
ncbi:hypothetical protein [Kineosporia babensis]|uniref:Uncharacterized protein n=1 Tax=Kineosporia babensis TaxID=499548 RepID=A0A9X1NGS3_9ACTN|nr:hypothetical protein [Kineosporia babensis]MCD5314837.1 hypothetical protein [Kineosporia babensis]